MAESPILRCPICKKERKESLKESPYGPFCSERCKSIDLLNWIEERYSIKCEVAEEDLEEENRSKS